MLAAAVFAVTWLSTAFVLVDTPTNFVYLGVYFGVGLMVAVAAVWGLPGMRRADPLHANRAVFRGLAFAAVVLLVQVAFAVYLFSQALKMF
jgi:hypothetical protein